MSKPGRPLRPAQSPASIRNQSPSHTQSYAEGTESANGAQIKQEVSDSSDTQGSGSDTLGAETGKTQISEHKTEEESGDQETSIKLEPMTESELDLEITGVEMGDSSLSGQMGFGQGDWAQNISFGQSGEGSQGSVEGFDPGSQGDFGNSKCIFLFMIRKL